MEESIDFQSVFDSAPVLALILSQDYTILAATDLYLRATLTERKEIIGRCIFEVFPDNPDDPNATGVQNLRASLESVIRNRAPHTMAVQKYDIRVPGCETFQERFWSPINSPVLGDDQEVRLIIHRVEDVTEFVHLKLEGLELTRASQGLQESNAKMEVEILQRGKELQERTRQLEEVNRQLLISRDDAIVASQLKSAFLTSVSHELRTPLGAILGLSELLVMDDSLSDCHKNISQTINDAGKALLALVNDILDLSKIEAGKLSLDLTNFDPAGLAREVIQLLQSTAKSKDLELELRVGEGLPDCVIADSGRIQQILLNLLGNAIKFTGNGSVSLSVEILDKTDDATKVKFSVADTGIGIREEDQKKLFVPFSQIKSEINYGGTGLGLTISKRLVELMGGEMGLESRIGQGSTFWFTLTLEHSNLQQTASVSNELSEFSGAARILIIEDQPVMRDLIRSQMNNLGLACDIASDAEEGLKQLQTVNYDLILMDCHLPKMDGLMATRTIRSSEQDKHRRIPIIAMTAGAMKGDREKCLEAGMDDFLSKPYVIKELRDKLRQWLTSSDKLNPSVKLEV